MYERKEPTITPKRMREVFTDDVLAELPSDKEWRRQAALYELHQRPDWRAKQKAGIQAKAQDPEWRAKQKVQGQANAQNPNWRANQKAGVQAKAQDPEWRAKQKAGIQAKTQDPEWQAKQRAGAKVRSQDPAWIERNKAANQASAKARSKPYHSPQGDFASVGDAIKASGLHQSKFRHLARLDPANYYYLAKPAGNE